MMMIPRMAMKMMRKMKCESYYCCSDVSFFSEAHSYLPSRISYVFFPNLDFHFVVFLPGTLKYINIYNKGSTTLLTAPYIHDVETCKGVVFPRQN